MSDFNPLRELPSDAKFGEGDTLVIFGEVFRRGYVNGLIDAAEKRGMNVIYSTVGRREKDSGDLRALTTEELAEQPKNFINIPIEAGFDYQPDSSGLRPIDQLQGIKLKTWHETKLDWASIEEAQGLATEDFQNRLRQWAVELEAKLPAKGNILFAHTMAGGVPRAKIVMPLMNRVFKGSGDRYMSSEEFWSSDIGRLCDANFMDVTAMTFKHLVEATSAIRSARSNALVSYVAYGYHGTELLLDGKYQWQSYSPYLQGWAKRRLEELSVEASSVGLKTCVFNAPEILTDSSSVFLGVEVPLYLLLRAIGKEQGTDSKIYKDLKSRCADKLKDPAQLDQILDRIESFFRSDIIKGEMTEFDQWPQHNKPKQMEIMHQTSKMVLDAHKDLKSLMSAELSEIIFKTCGEAMLREAAQPKAPYQWIGHDLVAQLAH
ncbi:MAG: hypothetical protein CL675_13795 [Bdellovibrionaceae bacterium]|nr:hypothetical protein [Pseudobdellovibrionaceae bacterium]